MQLSSACRSESSQLHTQSCGQLTLNSNGDEAPRAYIVPQTPDKASPELAEAIKAWLAERVSRHKRLEGGVHFIDAVPKNPVSLDANHMFCG